MAVAGPRQFSRRDRTRAALKVLHNCHIMTCNVTFEYEKTEVQSGFFYTNADEREKLVESERKWLDERCRAVVEFKRSVCKEGEVSLS